MLVIREAHMEAFARAMEEGFKLRAVQHLRKRYPLRTRGRPKEELHLVVERGLADGRRYAFETEKHAIAFIELGFIYGADFHEREQVAAILARNETTAKRLEALREAGYRH